MYTEDDYTPEPALQTSDIPNGPGDWPLKQIQAKLSRPLPASMLEEKHQGGQKLLFIPWHKAVKVLNKYAPGWQWEIRQTQISDRRIFMIGRLTIPTSDGPVYREASGTEELIRIDKNGEIQELAYGDPSSNAESMAFRRCCAKFGLALYLYDK